MQNVDVVKCRLFFMLRRNALSSYLFVKLSIHLSVRGIPDSTSKNFPYSGIRITWHRANHTDSWLKLHMRSHIPSPYIRCSTRHLQIFLFVLHKKLQFTRNVANKWGREWSTKNFVRRRDKSWFCSYQEKRPEFENNRYCSVLLFLIVSCLVRTKTINVKQ